MKTKRKVRCGLIGCGLMGREFAVVTGRWPALMQTGMAPELVAVCDLNESLFGWYTENFESIKTVTTNYQDLLADKNLDFIYCSVPHNLHEKLYIDIIKSGKHFLGEKPFGINLEANNNILSVLREHPDVFARCSSEFPYYPAGIEIQKMIRENPWGKIIEVNTGFLHSSDINFDKAINWKRKIDFNGEYGCMGDLGMHALHIPIRSGWFPKKLYASLSKIVDERPDGKGGMAVCETWDNASIYSEVEHPSEGYTFPMSTKTYRIAPGETDTWFIEIMGTKCSVRYSTKYPKTLQTMHYENGARQEWKHEDLGYSSVYQTVTGPIFEFGFTDSLLQMWAACFDEFLNPGKYHPFGCITPEETGVQHQILTAALESGKSGHDVSLNIQ
ncbi:MAG: Gfo/Idh/MocA family oxidoreductase [Balneolales bacterium]